ncbi:hypothetical protein NicSoilB4_26820 [Arthrobacter sp. NicSoilB4]|nr:hypothetical protein NicSoilB4_26820 [Arthrobacter sp. NicSoilB4]
MKRNQSSCGPFIVQLSFFPAPAGNVMGGFAGQLARQRWSKSSAGAASSRWPERRDHVKVFTKVFGPQRYSRHPRGFSPDPLPAPAAARAVAAVTPEERPVRAWRLMEGCPS